MAGVKYIVPKHLKGKVVGIKPPKWERKDGGKFVLDECTQKELRHLYTNNYPIEKVGGEDDK